MVERYRKESVGYKRPPKHTRFQKGQSGNPRGRRKREPATAAAILAEELQSTISVTENGRPLKTDKITIVIKRAVNEAMKGESRPLLNLAKALGSMDQLLKTPTKNRPRIQVDITKLTLEEKMKMMKEMIANSKPLDEY